MDRRRELDRQPAQSQVILQKADNSGLFAGDGQGAAIRVTQVTGLCAALSLVTPVPAAAMALS
jgi:hypothetical protein